MFYVSVICLFSTAQHNGISLCGSNPVCSAVLYRGVLTSIDAFVDCRLFPHRRNYVIAAVPLVDTFFDFLSCIFLNRNATPASLCPFLHLISFHIISSHLISFPYRNRCPCCATDVCNNTTSRKKTSAEKKVS